jgi:lysophospholipase L1-like esterase
VGPVAVSLLAVVVAVVAGTDYLARDRVPTRHYETVPLSASPTRIAVIGDSYTAGFEDTGRGAANWTERAWQILAGRGTYVRADVAAEGGAGYAVRGNQGGLFGELTARVVQPDDALVVFFGSRNDEGVDPQLLAAKARDTFGLAHTRAPSARLLVIGPAWPTADVPDSILRIRDVLFGAALGAGAAWIDPIAERWFVGRPELIGADGVHPTDAGHQYLADMIAPLIRAQLST